jgi:limonene 1,2-monooxygenase
MRFGIFLAPFHAPTQNPTLALQRDLELIEWLDGLGYDEAWIGEHHSAGMEIIASPEVFIAAAAERTRSIRLGTGVISLPYHHPLMIADRMIQLDHLTKGRVMFGVGPGALPSDAHMMGIDPAALRPRMEEALEAVTALLTSDRPVSRQTDWFTLQDAQTQLKPYSWPGMEIAVAAQVSPAGPRAAGRFGAGMLSLGATSAGGFDVLGQHFQVWNERAQEHGHRVDRASWRLVGPMHVAETRAQALEDVQYGLATWVDYFRNVVVLPVGPDSDDPEVWARELVESNFAVIGTPEDAIAQIERLEKQTGGFGAFLTMHTEWAAPEAMQRSYELIAREVFPRFQGSTRGMQSSQAWCRADRPALMERAKDAVISEIRAEKARRRT